MKNKLRFTIKMKIWLSFLFLILITGGVGVLSCLSFIEMEQKSNDIVLDAVPIGQAARDLLTDLVNQETGVRGYLATEREEYLEPYLLGQSELQKDLQTIRDHEDKYPIMKDLVENKAYPEIQKLQTYFESQIALVKAGKAEEARQHINDGKQAMDNFRKVYQDILANVDNLTDDSWNDMVAAGERSKLAIITGGIVSLLMAIACALVLTRGIIRPIHAVNKQVKEIAEGEGDLTRTIQVSSRDEMYDLAQSFNRMVGTLRNLVARVGVSAEQVAASAEELAASAEQTSKATEQIAQTIQEVAYGADHQAKSAEQSAQAIEEMSIGLRQIAMSAQTVSHTTNESAKAAVAGSQTIQQAIEQMDSINRTVSSLEGVIKNLGESSQEIGQIVQVISGIAQQTNLLALNAAIEAARAGENGRGFAVVADEVRKLAEQSAASSEQIAQLIATIQVEANKAVESMEASAKEVYEGIEIVREAGKSFRQIKEKVNEVAGQIEEVSATAQQLSASTDAVVHSAAQITEIAKNTAAGTQSASAAAEEQLASMEEITASSNSLTQMAEELQALVGKFKV